MNLNIRLPRAAATLALALASFALTAGCNKDSNTVNSPESASSNSAPANAPAPANTPSPAKPAGLSPTETVKGYYEAGMRKDTAGVRRFLSRPSLQLMEELARSQGKTLEQLVGEAADKDARKRPPVFSNERVKGDIAAVDIEIPGEPLRTMPLVKEDGEWKLAFGNPKGGAIKR
ncbi:MAG TPA: hypothetical protein VD861_08930 [Pyrinomonadaceae bacterium]|nr:hypothetical protein [Pyrinomonadaceae bacterium]